ncbi:hypothetical protein KVT40_004262 [Elsinoe batatas]|uniref:Uncharacterized protein n=1 Tax=Elsinoe batatas TaxID=2601811 RepID=A0A8K0L4M1_9PEZI|nr:hypothetical protein KVT40_004262 [Elsinoe batatas]
MSHFSCPSSTSPPESMDEKSSHTTARSILCDEGSWQGDTGVCLQITFNQDGSGTLLGSRQIHLDVHVDFTWTPLDSRIDWPVHLPPPIFRRSEVFASAIPRKPELLAEFRIEINLHAVGPEWVQVDGKNIGIRKFGPKPPTRDPGPRTFTVRLERGYCTPPVNTSGMPPGRYELRIGFDSSPYLTRDDWDMEDTDYWEHKIFCARWCWWLNQAEERGITQYMRDRCVLS